ncbi:MAG: ABC transporter ATP-binding protein [Clostridium sp.]|nr:ABC transporter ATP-binding protein [Clostridium sp.]MCM1171513.1 ABC transporter ATP-binding protein [Clostridium sp.]MCM1208658.1 ABC transporter ATP-binding protein [Ruminococcus sp.]
MIRIKDLKKQYGTGSAACIALNKISLELPEKKFIAITGKSGSGKTTLLNMIGLIDKPNSGSIEVNGKDILKFNKKEIREYRRKTIGIVFQFFQLIPVINCYDNIVIANEFSPKYEKEYFDELVEQLDIGDLLNKYPEQLSGGQQQRIAIARALINRPRIILADEPTGNLDSENSENVVGLLKSVVTKYDMSLIMVTHDSDIVKEADINVCLVDGNVQ